MDSVRGFRDGLAGNWGLGHFGGGLSLTIRPRRRC